MTALSNKLSHTPMSTMDTVIPGINLSFDTNNYGHVGWKLSSNHEQQLTDGLRISVENGQVTVVDKHDVLFQGNGYNSVLQTTHPLQAAMIAAIRRADWRNGMPSDSPIGNVWDYPRYIFLDRQHSTNYMVTPTLAINYTNQNYVEDFNVAKMRFNTVVDLEGYSTCHQLRIFHEVDDGILVREIAFDGEPLTSPTINFMESIMKSENPEQLDILVRKALPHNNPDKYQVIFGNFAARNPYCPPETQAEWILSIPDNRRTQHSSRTNQSTLFGSIDNAAFNAEWELWIPYFSS